MYPILKALLKFCTTKKPLQRSVFSNPIMLAELLELLNLSVWLDKVGLPKRPLFCGNVNR